MQPTRITLASNFLSARAVQNSNNPRSEERAQVRPTESAEELKIFPGPKDQTKSKGNQNETNAVSSTRSTLSSPKRNLYDARRASMPPSAVGDFSYKTTTHLQWSETNLPELCCHRPSAENIVNPTGNWGTISLSTKSSHSWSLTNSPPGRSRPNISWTRAIVFERNVIRGGTIGDFARRVRHDSGN